MEQTLYNSAMIIEDNDTEVFLLERLLKTINYASDIIVFQNGQQAIEYFQKIAKGNISLKIPDIIFLDINMPVMNGFEFLEAFSKFPSDIKNKPEVIMLTSSEDSKDIEKAACYKEVKRFFIKPLEPKSLLLGVNNKLIKKSIETPIILRKKIPVLSDVKNLFPSRFYPLK
jgi:CheY-like chemotaxis protein